MSLMVKGLTKAYAGTPVLSEVDLAVNDGEIHALLGANGAGKSTLIKCVSGAIKPSAGEIVLDGQSHRGFSPKEALRANVAVIYQEASVASTLTIAENVFLGEELHRGLVVRRHAQRDETMAWLRRLGAELHPDTRVSELSAADVQVVEIVRSLRRKPRLLILDEPTAGLTEREATRLSEHLRALKRERLPMLYVTHRLGEVFDLADRVTVLRGGRVRLSARVSECTHEDLFSAIAGRELVSAGARQGFSSEAPPQLLRVRGLSGPGIGPVDLDVGAGEIVGVFGLVGSGRTELLEHIFAARPMHTGTIELEGRELRLRQPADAIAAGITLVPSDRHRNSIFAGRSALDNTLLASSRRLARFGVRQRRTERRVFDDVAELLRLEPRAPSLDAERFSGGNQQKLVLGRWLQPGQRSKLLLLDEPTQGVDVGARGDLYEALRSYAAAGRGVLVTSSEPQELMQLADRVVVLSRGSLVGTLSGADLSERRLLELAHLHEHAEVA